MNKPHDRTRGRRTRRPLCLETLEGRTLLSGSAAADYVLSGTQWPNPAHISYSIAPDGVNWDGASNNLNATFNALFGNGNWQREIARALATWEAVANINIVQVGETGSWPLSTTGQTQGDPRFGDIRFGGANLNDSQMLAESYSPPSAGASQTIYGNVEINTPMPWHIGSDFDFYSVMLHETGLSLGLNEPPPGGDVVMNTIYGGIRAWLMPGDIAGIQAIYGARTPDSYQSRGQGASLATAVDVTPGLGSSLQTTVNNVSLSSIGSAEYFSVGAPANSGNTLSVTASAVGISLFSPAVSVYDASGQQLGAQSNPSAWGNAVTVQVSGVVPGQRYYIKVSGATSDAFSVGAYQLQVSFPSGVLPPPSKQTATAPVVAIYEEVLNREPTTEEVTTWNQQLQSGLSPQQLTLALYQSPERDALTINNLFQRYLDRSADPAALGVFSNWLSLGATSNAIALAIISSPEFTSRHTATSDFLSAIYEDILGRAPDAAGSSVFTQWLNQGAAPAQVAQALLGSYESHMREIQVAYTSTLDRSPDAPGQQYFLGTLQSGNGSLDIVYIGLLLSDENMGRVGY